MTSEKIKKQSVKSFEDRILKENYLILHNDNIHSFDYVINALIDICGHAYEQAVQCTFIAHYKGKCGIKKGVLETLEHMKEVLTERKLNVTID